MLHSALQTPSRPAAHICLPLHIPGRPSPCNHREHTTCMEHSQSCKMQPHGMPPGCRASLHLQLAGSPQAHLLVCLPGRGFSSSKNSLGGSAGHALHTHSWSESMQAQSMLDLQ